MSVKITSVTPESPAQRAGIQGGETLLQINGRDINDVLDYEFYAAETKLKIKLPDRVVKVKKDEYEDLGLSFETYLMDEKRCCKNNCIFCFISQLPKGMRDTLYFKDDDARLSFLQGNYITMTNLTDEEVDRIIRMKLRMNVSVHTTNPELRCKMTRNPHAGEALRHLWKMAKHKVELNCQIVLCPSINDGAELERTLTDLTALYPSVTSIACVPLGLTKHREGLMELKPFDKEAAESAIDIMERFGEQMLKKHGKRVVYPADEFYLLCGREMPNYDFYEEFEQYENGVGMWSSLRQEFISALGAQNAELVPVKRRKAVATGRLAAPLIRELAERVKAKFPLTQIEVYEIRNDFFGESITVAGLITGQDIVRQLGEVKDLPHELLITSAMLRSDREVFLDDMRLGDIERELGVTVTVTECDGGDLLERFISDSPVS